MKAALWGTASLTECAALLLDVVLPLTRRTDLPEQDRAVLIAFCESEDRRLNLARRIVTTS